MAWMVGHIPRLSLAARDRALWAVALPSVVFVELQPNVVRFLRCGDASGTEITGLWFTQNSADDKTTPLIRPPQHNEHHGHATCHGRKFLCVSSSRRTPDISPVWRRSTFLS